MTTASARRARADTPLLLLTALAFAARAAYLLLEPGCSLTGDEPSWIALGTQQLGRPNRGLDPLRNGLIFYPPVYPYFIALVFRATGSLRAILWLQAAFGALLVPALGRAGQLALGRRCGLVAAALAAFYPELLWYPAHYWSETLYLLLLWWAIERTLAADAARSWRTAAVAGALWGLATLTRELSLYLVPIVALWLVRDRLRSSLPRAAALALAAALTVAPWTLRNLAAFHAFIPVSTMGGLNLWQGNTTLTHLEIYERLASKGGPVEQDRYCRQMAWQTIAARQPRWLLEKLAEQMPEFWKAGAEVLDHLVGRGACGVLPAARRVALEAAFVAPYLAVLGLGLVGLARLRAGAGAWLLLLLLAAYNAAHVVAYATTRFRLPVLPVVFLLAGVALVGRADGVALPLRGWRLVLLALLCAAVAATLVPGLAELASWQALVGAGA